MTNQRPPENIHAAPIFQGQATSGMIPQKITVLNGNKMNNANISLYQKYNTNMNAKNQQQIPTNKLKNEQN